MQELFKQINRGNKVTSHLSHLTKEEKMTRRAKAKESGGKVMTKKRKGHPSPTGKPVFEKIGLSFECSNLEGNHVLPVCDMKTGVQISHCANATITVPGKCSKLTMLECKGVNVIFDGSVSGVEVTNCTDIKIQVLNGVCSNFLIDGVKVATYYLNNESRGAQFHCTAAMSNNLVFPKLSDTDDMVTVAIPEQFLVTVQEDDTVLDETIVSAKLAAGQTLQRQIDELMNELATKNEVKDLSELGSDFTTASSLETENRVSRSQSVGQSSQVGSQTNEKAVEGQTIADRVGERNAAVQGGYLLDSSTSWGRFRVTCEELCTLGVSADSIMRSDGKPWTLGMESYPIAQYVFNISDHSMDSALAAGILRQAAIITSSVSRTGPPAHIFVELSSSTYIPGAPRNVVVTILGDKFTANSTSAKYALHKAVCAQQVVHGVPEIYINYMTPSHPVWSFNHPTRYGVAGLYGRSTDVFDCDKVVASFAKNNDDLRQWFNVTGNCSPLPFSRSDLGFDIGVSNTPSNLAVAGTVPNAPPIQGVCGHTGNTLSASTVPNAPVQEFLAAPVPLVTAVAAPQAAPIKWQGTVTVKLGEKPVTTTSPIAVSGTV